jgi:hypothetical protein
MGMSAKEQRSTRVRRQPGVQVPTQAFTDLGFGPERDLDLDGRSAWTPSVCFATKPDPLALHGPPPTVCVYIP